MEIFNQKEFKDIVFNPNPYGGVSGLLEINGFKVSVQGGAFAYSTPKENLKFQSKFSSFEVAVIDTIGGDWATKSFVEDGTDDVLGWQSRKDINSLLTKIQNQ
tara:strand:+ start:40 stop:348 length:309 start_codon:yes stop_codon:yes gene_type:complete